MYHPIFPTLIDTVLHTAAVVAPFDLQRALRSLANPGVLMVKVPTGRIAAGAARKVRCFVEFVPNQVRA